jgi:hypothetical protein
MSTAYIIEADGSTNPMERVRCKNEELELQRILEKNPDLLPGDQINPEDPRRWLQIAREMPVPNPSTGTDQWSIDFFFVDQSAMPTFIECKRFEDTRSRREVVGQMLEYAANGHYYWDKEMIRDLAGKSAQNNGFSLEESLRELRPDQEIDVDTFFEHVENNLREGQIRLIFFLEEAPMELKSVVDFLNRQMEKSEVLLVEARQYRRDNMTVVVPMLFGYTEEARQVKKRGTVVERRQWTHASFFADAHARLPEKSVNTIEKIFEACTSLPCNIAWGTGKIDGSLSVKWPQGGNKTVFTILSNGRLWISFGALSGNELAESFRDRLKDLIADRLGLTIPDDYQHKYPSYQISEWEPKADSLIQILRELLDEFQQA